MSKKVYLGYIGYIYANTMQLVTRKEWMDFLISNLGDKPTEKTAKNTAFMLYYAHYARLLSCIGEIELLNKLKTVSKLKEFLIETGKVRQSYHVGQSIKYYTTESKVIEHMKRMALSEKTILNFMKTQVQKKPPTSKKTKKPSQPRRTSKKPSPSRRTSSTRTCKEYTLTELKKKASEKKIVGRSSMNKNQLCKELGIKSTTNRSSKPTTGNCKSYTVAELRKMAAEKKIVGRSSMNKVQLCKALKISQ